jgi:serine O-acetyltransferase
MQATLTPTALADYVARQLNHFFPDDQLLSGTDLASATSEAMDRVEYCFSHACLPRYFREGEARFNHLHSDQYLVFLWFLSNSIWRRGGAGPVADKVYYLNKALHAFDCVYENGLPDIFLVFHGVGTVLGKGTYGNYLWIAQGCTVGQHRGVYPRLGEWVGLAANSSIIGDCTLGDGATVGAGTYVVNQDIPAGHVVFRDRQGVLTQRESPPLARGAFRVGD